MSKTLAAALIAILLILPLSTAQAEEPRVIHVFVALADNAHQNIAPVPKKLGNGSDPAGNLYWGALYGVKTFFKKSPDWTLVSEIKNPAPNVLERCVFKHRGHDIYLVADAYKGKNIKNSIDDFLGAAAGKFETNMEITQNEVKTQLRAGSAANLLAYVGHNGLMDFEAAPVSTGGDGKRRETIILACYSKDYFKNHIEKAGARPLLWTTGLMAPEAYSLKAAIDGWINNEPAAKIRERSAAAYDKYQRCGIRAAKNLLVN